MRHSLTMLGFALFFSAIGYTGCILLQLTRESGESAALENRPRGDPGPYLQTVDHLASALELTADQRVALRALIDDTAERMELCQREQRSIVLASRSAVLELLTPEQNFRLERTVEDYWSKYRERRVDAAHELCETEFGLCALEVARITAAFRVYEEEKGEWFRRSRLEEQAPDHHERERKQRQLRADFERRMEGVLSADQQVRLWQAVDSLGHECVPESQSDVDRASGADPSRVEGCEEPVGLHPVP